MHDGRAFARDFSGRKRTSFEYTFQNFFDAECESIGLGQTLNLRLAVTRPQNRGELTKSIKTLVVHLDNDDAFELGEHFLEPIWQWMKVAKVQRPGILAMFTSEFHCVVDRTVSGTPTNDQCAAFLIAIDFRYWDFFGKFAQFIAPLRRHCHVQL